MPPGVSDIVEMARLAANSLADYGRHLVHPTVRLGVTGLSRAGQNRIHHRAGTWAVTRRTLSGVRAARGRTHCGCTPCTTTDDAIPRFGYEAYLRQLVEAREWPQSTTDLAQLRLVLDYQSASGATRELDARPDRLSRRMAARPAAAQQDLRRMVGGESRDLAPDAARDTRGPSGTRIWPRLRQKPRPTSRPRSLPRGCSLSI